MIQAKLDQLKATLRSYGSCLVAYSGGVDSAFLAAVAHEVLGERALAVIADSPSLPRRELEAALELGRREGFGVRVVRTKEFSNSDYLANPPNRCFFCKHELFSELEPLAKAGGLAVIVFGENASDLGDYRPGVQAAVEFGVRAPLREVGLTKAEIRELSAQRGLPTADKPQLACLSSRIPYGEAVTPEKLRMIEAAENVLRDLGFVEVRVRHHTLGAGGVGGAAAMTSGGGVSPGDALRLRHLARIELGPHDLERLVASDLLRAVAGRLREVGYAHVTLDLEGYRRGSLNEGVSRPVTAVEGKV